ncbi:hypothetical protein LOTGIDRAFT_157284 [Lottia gigantea]|uniref:Uncharacterized protein n=1 Tax=Lottia gigantea TaxID=225164 RepID=V4B8L7_LOTGI|nr:hypothetical protein LOTGIDRAFT_157284 [Lottia gigantea]ESP02132.1 hypothetical protein LOTGIDRAFT_157284 [Lottia gigantea]
MVVDGVIGTGLVDVRIVALGTDRVLVRGIHVSTWMETEGWFASPKTHRRKKGWRILDHVVKIQMVWKGKTSLKVKREGECPLYERLPMSAGLGVGELRARLGVWFGSVVALDGSGRSAMGWDIAGWVGWWSAIEKQSSSYRHMKILSSEDTSEECLLQMDFAENFTCIWQDEIQSAHWKQRQVTIYTIMITYRNKKLSYVIISDFLSHEKTAVAFTSTILDIITDKFPTVRTADVWTDGPSSQYKNKYIFALLPRLQDQHAVRIRWNHFATSHGKGPNDGIGIVHRLIMSRSTVVSDSQSFANALRSSGTLINVVELTEDDIKDKCKMLDVETLWSGLQIFPGTISRHCAQSVGNGMVQLKFFTTDPPQGMFLPSTQRKQLKSVGNRMKTGIAHFVRGNMVIKRIQKFLENGLCAPPVNPGFMNHVGSRMVHCTIATNSCVKSVCKNKSEFVKIAMT